MPTAIKHSEVRKLLPHRDKFSHKGENGRLLIIGGSIDYFGAPILAGLAALGSGTDLVYLLVPECNFDVSRSFYPDFIVQKYDGDFINKKTVAPAIDLINKTDAVLIGPGIGKNPKSADAIIKIIKVAKCPIILDAEAIPIIKNLDLKTLRPNAPHEITITPHHGEFFELTGALPTGRQENFSENESKASKIAEEYAKKLSVTILLKGHTDIIASPDQPTKINKTGNAGMTSGGTGDVLAGLVSGLISQHASPYHATICAAFLNGLAGDSLYRRKGYNFTATDLALELPYIIKKFT